MSFPQVSVNFVSILVAAIASMVIGAFWYSPILFGKVWIREMGLKEKEMKKMKKGSGKSYVANFITLLITSYILALLIKVLSVATLMEGVRIGFLLWLGFIATVMLGSVLWEGKSVKLYLIGVSYQLVSIVVMSLILVRWV